VNISSLDIPQLIREGHLQPTSPTNQPFRIVIADKQRFTEAGFKHMEKVVEEIGGRPQTVRTCAALVVINDAHVESDVKDDLLDTILNETYATAKRQGYTHLHSVVISRPEPYVGWVSKRTSVYFRGCKAQKV